MPSVMEFYPMWGRELTKLDKNVDFYQWKFCVLTVLKALDLDGYIYSKKVTPNMVTAYSEYVEWKKGDAAAVLVLLASLDSTVLNTNTHHVYNGITASGIWIQLEANYCPH